MLDNAKALEPLSSPSSPDLLCKTVSPDPAREAEKQVFHFSSAESDSEDLS